MANCPLCNIEADIAQIGGRNMSAVGCEVCGVYNIDINVAKLLNEDEQFEKKKYILSSLSRLGWEAGENIEITSENLRSLIDNVKIPVSPMDYMHKVLKYILSKTHNMSTYLIINLDIYPLFFLKDKAEFEYILEKLLERDYIELNQQKDAGYHEYRLTVQGWDYVSNLPSAETASKVFVAMSFNKTMNEIWEQTLLPVFEALNIQVVKINRKNFNPDITSAIMDCDIFVAELTDHKHRIYYQAGVAAGAKIPSLWLCRADKTEHAVFESNDYNIITWESAEDLAAKFNVALSALLRSL